MNGQPGLDHRASIGLLLATAALVAGIGGCAMPIRSFTPDVQPNTLGDTAFLHYLATVPLVTVDEGMRAVLLLTDARSHPTDYDTRFDRLLGMGAVRENWQLSADQLLDKGSLAFMLRTVCDLRGGLNEALAARTGLGDRRYALKTCVHAGLMRYARPNDPVTGGELLSALTAAETHMPGAGRQKP